MKNIIEINQLTKTYNQAGNIITIFEDMDFTVKQGDFISVIGPSGSGKTTLLNLISGLDSKYKGTIKVFNKNLSDINEKEKTILRLKNIGFVYQFDSLIYELNPLENIELPYFILHNKTNHSKSYELLKNFSMENIAFSNSSNLSGGEKQRITILRAIRNNPKLLLADEPTGNLDYENAEKIMQDFKKLNSNGLTIIIVTHNLDLAKKYTKSIFMLKNKKLVKYEM
jgi:ABC-type lipoprotein export system ATPase subunit